MTSFYKHDEVQKLGLKSVGNNVLISRKSSIYGASNIIIGDNVRIDDFCILSGKITIGSNIHIAAYSAVYGGDACVQIEDFANISSRVCVYAISDDYSGKTMTNPMIPDEFKNVTQKSVFIGRHVIIGSGSTVLPGLRLEEGTAVGAMSLINRSTKAWTIYAGIPAKELKQRSRDLLDLEKAFLIRS